MDEQRTPIEDASVNWPTPYTTVALPTLPQQAENQALALHRRLGDVQRARKVVYFQSQQGRAAGYKPA